MKLSTLKILLLIFCFGFLFSRAYLVSSDDQQGGRAFMRGDGFSDRNTLSAVRYFYDHGFWKSKLRPMFDYPEGKEPRAYTHYPALPDVIAGVESHILGTTNESALRIFPIFCAFIIFLMIFKINSILLFSREEAFLGAALAVLSSYFLAWGDTLHKHTYEELWKYLTFFLLLAFYGYPKSYFESKKWNRNIVLALLFCVSYLNIQTSFESAVFCIFLITGFSIVFEKNKFLKLFGPLTMFCALAFVLGFATHIYLNALYFGSWDQAIRDLHEALLVRTGRCGEGSTCGLTWMDRMRLLTLPIERFDRQFAIPGVIFVYMCFLVFKKFLKTDKTLFHVSLVLVAASLAWYLVMPQHAFVHGFVGKHPGPLAALVMGCGVLEIWRRQRASTSLKSSWFYGALLGVSLVSFLWNQVYIIYWKYGFSYWFH